MDHFFDTQVSSINLNFLLKPLEFDVTIEKDTKLWYSHGGWLDVKSPNRDGPLTRT